MASEIRVNSLTNRSGLSTVTIADTGAVVAGIVTATSFSGPLTGNVTGNITATNGTFSGNVSIGGVLTYEDVTNVDSVGIVTAQSGIHVTGGHIDLVDNSKIRVGTGDDLEIYHSGSHSFITDSGTGNLYINSSKLVITDAGDTETMANFIENGAVELFHNGVKKLETKTDGVDITGELQCDTLDVDGLANIQGSLTVQSDILMGDNDLLKIGDSDDLQISHNGSTSIINGLYHPIEIRHQSEVHIKCVDDGAVELYHNNTKKFETQSSGVAIHEDTDKTLRFTGSIGEIGNVTGFQATNTAGSALVDFGMRANTLRFATGSSERLRIASNGTTTVGPQYDRVTIEPGNGTYDGEATTLTVDGRTNDGNRVALKVDRYGSGTSATTKFSVKYDGTIFTTSGMQAASVNLQSSSTSSWFQTGTSIASYPYVWAAKNSSSNTWHSGLQTDGDLYLGGNLASTNNIGLIGSTGSGWFSGGLGIGGFAAANTIDEYEEGTWTPVMNKSGVAGTAGTPSTGVGYYRRVGQLLWISFYWYKGSGGFGNNANEWYVSGLPFLLAHGTGSAYQFIPGGYNHMNGTNYQNQSNRWQSNAVNGSATLSMYGPNSTTNWTSGYLELSASGCLMLP